MIDKLVIVWSDVWWCRHQPSVALLTGGLANGRNLRGDRMLRGFRWDTTRPLSLRLRCCGRADDFMASTVTFERYASPSGMLTLTGEIHINPTRLLRHLGEQSLDQWFGTCRGIFPQSVHDRYDNVLRVDPAAGVHDDYFWCDLSANIADRFISLVMAALFGDPSRRPLSVRLKQAEAYWEFASPTPIPAVNDVAPAIRACAGASEARYERSDDWGLPVLGLWLGSANSGPRLALYPRDGRVRVEIRYLSNVSRLAPGAGRGDLTHRLRSVADASACHAARALSASRPYRCQSALFGAGDLIELQQRIIAVVGGQSSRIRHIVDYLLRNGYVRAGDAPGCIITLNEAQRLHRAGVLVRRSVRTRDRGGRVFALDAYFENLGT